MLMKTLLIGILGIWIGAWAAAGEPLEFRPLFNGKDLDGWVNVNTGPETWSVEDGMIVCTGLPIGVMRTERQYENFILEIEWMHLEAGGNSGVFVWSEGEVTSKNRLPSGMEVQMLELEYPKIHNRVQAYASGELFGAGTVTAIPENPRGKRSVSLEYRCKGVHAHGMQAYSSTLREGQQRLRVSRSHKGTSTEAVGATRQHFCNTF